MCRLDSNLAESQYTLTEGKIQDKSSLNERIRQVQETTSCHDFDTIN